MNHLDDRLRASDPSRAVEPPEDVLAAILAAPVAAPAAPPRAPRAPRRRKILIPAVGLAACTALALGITLPGGGGPGGPSFVARAYAQTAPKPAVDQVVHIIESSTQDVGDIHQVDKSESWQYGSKWHLTTSDVETGGRDFSDVEEQLFDGDVIRSWFTHAKPQELRATDGDEAKQIIERSRKSPLDRFREAYEDQQLIDLGIVDFEGRRAHAYRVDVKRAAGDESKPPVPMYADGAHDTFYFDPDTATPLGSTITFGTEDGGGITVKNVISVWEELPPTPENLRKVTERG